MKECPTCGYEWKNRVSDPIECPECKTRLHKIPTNSREKRNRKNHEIYKNGKREAAETVWKDEILAIQILKEMQEDNKPIMAERRINENTWLEKRIADFKKRGL